MVNVARLFSVGSVKLLRREKKEHCVRDCINNCEDDAAVDLMMSMHNYLLFLQIQRKRGTSRPMGSYIKGEMMVADKVVETVGIYIFF